MAQKKPPKKTIHEEVAEIIEESGVRDEVLFGVREGEEEDSPNFEKVQETRKKVLDLSIKYEQEFRKEVKNPREVFGSPKYNKPIPGTEKDVYLDRDYRWRPRKGRTIMRDFSGKR